MKASPCVGLFCEVNMRNNLLAAIVSALGGSVTNMNNRNKILADIVIASGGTVTNINDRNQLLQDWLDSYTSGVEQFSFLDQFSMGNFQSAKS